MIERTILLPDLQKLLQRLAADLLERSESVDVPEDAAQSMAGRRRPSRRTNTFGGLADRLDQTGGVYASVRTSLRHPGLLMVGDQPIA